MAPQSKIVVLVTKERKTKTELYAEFLQRGDELGVFKKAGGTSAMIVWWSTGRQC